MNITILNGAPGNGRGTTLRAIASTIADEARAKGWPAATFDLDGLDIKPCRGCFACWLKHPGTCAIKDDEEPIVKAIASTDLIIWMTPVVFGGYGPELKKALDRSISILSPFFTKLDGETHHKRRYSRYPTFAAVGLLRRVDQESEEIFRRLVWRNAINIYAPAFSVEIAYESEGPVSLGAKVDRLLERVEVAA